MAPQGNTEKVGALGASLSKKALEHPALRLADDKVKLIAEFVGTYMLVFAVGLNKTTGANDAGLKTFGPTSVACTLMVMIYALGSISGGHFNPAVTFAAVVHKADGFAPKVGLMYIVTQLLAGCAAGGTTILMYGVNATDATHGAIGPQDANMFVGACLVEFLYTFMLVFVVFNVCFRTDEKAVNNYYGVAIGFVIIAGGYGGGYVSGGAFNPAIALGMNLMTLSGKSVILPVIILCEFLGGFFAVTAFRTVRPSEKSKHDVSESLIPQLEALGRKIEDLFDPEDTAEFLGTTFLVFTISLNGMLSTQSIENPDYPAQGPQYIPNPTAAALAVGSVWSIGACLMCMIFAVGDISGGLFNPAVTIAFLGRYLHTGGGIQARKGEPPVDAKDVCKICDPLVKWNECLKYFTVQMIGGAAGAGLNVLVYFTSGQWPAMAVGAKDPFTVGQAFFAEFYGTFLLCYVILCVATTNNPLQEYCAFCIGGCLIAAGYAFGPLSGGLLNPAVTVALGCFHQLEIIYEPGPVTFLLAQMLGGIVAAILFRFVTHREQSENTEKFKNLAVHGREGAQDGYFLVTDA